MVFTKTRTKMSPWACALALWCICGAVSAFGQGRGFGGGGGGNTSSSGSNMQTRQYLNNTMLGDAMIEVDPETRSIIIIADADTNENIGNLITELDQPKPQVLIKILFLEITHRNGLDYGAEGSFNWNRGNTAQSVGTDFGLGSLGQGGAYQLFDSQFEVTLKALAENGKFEVLSRPSILARNNQEAVITVGKEVPFIRNSRFLQTGQQINTVEYEDIGIILRVTPFITNDGLVELIVAPEISTTTDQTVPISAGVEAPVFAKRSAETVVVTSDSQTVIIGGLMENNKTESIKKVPILGDIPVIGWPFRRTVTENTKTELMIFLTPHIIPHPSMLAKITEDEKQKTQLSGNTFSEADLNRFLEQNEKTPEPSEGFKQGAEKNKEEKKRRWFSKKNK